jgi:hypothetical protein
MTNFQVYTTQKMKIIFTSVLVLISVISGVSQEKAINYKELQKMLPSSIMGYSPSGDPDGSSFEMNGMSYSTAVQDYESGDSELTISLFDYQGAAAMYSSTTMAWGMGMSFEDDEQSAKGVDINGSKGWHVYQKEDHTSELMVGHKDRYLITIVVTEADQEKAIEIFKKLDLSKLP